MPQPDFPTLDCLHLESVTSTNDYLKQFVEDGQWRRVSASRQSAGRGRYGRHWHSASDEGLYVSFLLYPALDLSVAAGLLEAASVAVVDSLETAAPTVVVRLKRPNDVMIGGRKLAGILIELGTTHQQLNWVIVGVGLNLKQTSFPADLEGRATSLKLEGVEISDSERLCDSLTDALLARLAQLCSGQRPILQKRYRQLLDTSL